MATPLIVINGVQILRTNYQPLTKTANYSVSAKTTAVSDISDISLWTPPAEEQFHFMNGDSFQFMDGTDFSFN